MLKSEKVEELPKDSNWLLIGRDKGMRFVFNKFKTSWKEGQKVVDVPAELAGKLRRYLKHHPMKDEKEFALLVNSEGKPQNAVNSITRILNRILGKKVGPSMLRHIFITEKHGGALDEQEKDAELMSHSVQTQRKYAKRKPKVQSVEVPTISSQSEEVSE